MDAPAELEALRQRVAELEALLPRPEPPVQLRPARYEATPPTTRALAELASSGPLRRLTIREVRQLAVAVALSRGAVTLPGAEVPADYAPDMARLAEARAAGLGWRAALERCGMEVPDEGEVAHHVRTLRDGLRDLWDGVGPIVGALERVLPNWQHRELLDSLRGLLV